MLSDYGPIVVLFTMMGTLVAVILVLTSILGPKRHSEFKAETFECGSDPIGEARRRFSVKFYVIAILFILFDIEGIFIVPWAIKYQDLGMFGFVEMCVFVGILVVGLAYVWRKGGLEWE